MKLNEFIEKCGFTLVNEGAEDIELTKVYCCDLLSFAMARMSATSAYS